MVSLGAGPPLPRTSPPITAKGRKHDADWVWGAAGFAQLLDSRVQGRPSVRTASTPPGACSLVLTPRVTAPSAPIWRQ